MYPTGYSPATPKVPKIASMVQPKASVPQIDWSKLMQRQTPIAQQKPTNRQNTQTYIPMAQPIQIKYAQTPARQQQSYMPAAQGGQQRLDLHGIGLFLQQLFQAIFSQRRFR